MATYAVYQGFVRDAAGNVVPGAHIRVRSEIPGQPLAALKSSRTGGALTNPFDADADGFFQFYVVGGAYQIEAYDDDGDISPPLRHVAVGLNAESDSIASRTQRVVTAAGTVTIDADDADIVVINKTVGAATTVNLPSAASRSRPIMIVDGKGDAATNNITIVPISGQSIFATVDYQPKIDGNGGALILTPKEDGTGWF